jgi:hypothetical protein
MFLEERKRYVAVMTDHKKRETQDELLDDLWTLCDRDKLTFFPSAETVRALKELSDTWKYYLDKPDGLNPKNLASLLARYDIKPDPDGKGDTRGYQALAFRVAWRVERGKRLPDHLKQFDIDEPSDTSDASDTLLTYIRRKKSEDMTEADGPPPFHNNVSDPSDPSYKREARVSPRNYISSLSFPSQWADTMATAETVDTADTNLVVAIDEAEPYRYRAETYELMRERLKDPKIPIHDTRQFVEELALEAERRTPNPR